MNSYSNLNYLPIVAMGAILRIVRDCGQLFFLTSLPVSYLPLSLHRISCSSELLESQTVHAGREFNNYLIHLLHGINEKRKAQ